MSAAPSSPRCRTRNSSRSPGSCATRPSSTRSLASGSVLFAVEIPADFERALRRGDDPALLVAADATDPVATGPAIAALSEIVNTALAKDRGLPDAGQPLFEIRAHERYNPAASTPFNIVPGLLGTILT